TNFYKKNIAVVNAQGKESIIGIIKTLDLLRIKWRVVVDDDFLDMKKTFLPVCKHLMLDINESKQELRKHLFNNGFVVLKKGETENLIPIEDIAEMTGKTINQIVELMALRPKLSEIFEKELFKKSKPEIAFAIVDYYKVKFNSPFDKLIKWMSDD
ncbi:MAG: hypothetical protein RBR81_07745, partial [Bacteroidales bacterium]|nr:hypothetical protein [Bacteroidales bacterium]